AHEHHAHEHESAAPLWWGRLDFLFLAISFLAIHYSARKTSLKWMPYALYISWGVLAAYVLVEAFHLFHVSHTLIYFPALSLVGLHLYNRHHCRCEDEACCSEV
ncbi:MAG: MerC domain-containing protein, partial [Bacteroidota bacterium]